jgi:hypothetical protein
VAEDLRGGAAEDGDAGLPEGVCALELRWPLFLPVGLGKPYGKHLVVEGATVIMLNKK